MEKGENEEVNPMQSKGNMRLKEMERAGEIKMGKHEREQHKERKKERKRVLLQEIEPGG